MQRRSARALGAMAAIAVCALLMPRGVLASLCVSYGYADGTKVCERGVSCTDITSRDPNVRRCALATCEVSIGCPGAPTQLGQSCITDTECGVNLSCVGVEVAQAPGEASSAGKCLTPNPPQSTATIEYHPVQPKLNITIPGLEFSKLPDKLTPGDTVISIPWIAQYFAAIFRWAVRVGAILAVIVIMVGGVLWMTSGVTGQHSTAKDMITNAVIGLVLLVGSYTIIALIDPNLVTFRALRLEVVQPQFIESEEEQESVEGFEPPDERDVVLVEGENIVNIQSKSTGQFQRVPSYLLPPLQEVARALASQDIQLRVTSGFRSETHQQKLIRQNCTNLTPEGKPTTATACNPATCLLRNGPRSCPHTTGGAVDVWGAMGGVQCQFQKSCARTTAIKQAGWDTNVDICHTDPCQAAVIDAMRNAGFCNWAGEAWHFEWGNGFSEPCE